MMVKSEGKVIRIRINSFENRINNKTTPYIYLKSFAK